MKRAIIAILLLVCLALGANAQEISHVSDLANVLTAEERADLQQQAADLYQQTGFDVIFHTTNDSQQKMPFDYSMDYYIAFRDVKQYPDGAMLSILFDTRDYYEATVGKGIDLLTHRENHDLAGIVRSKLSDGDYYGAFRDYLHYVKRLLIPPSPVQRAVEWLPYMLIGGLVIGLIYALILKSKLKIAKFQSGADYYVLPNSLNLTDSRDIYLYQTVTRTKIQSTSSGGGGGGFSSGSRGGTSFGGRGGKF